MKNLLLLLGVVCISLVACEKTEINEETSEIEELDTPLYKTDKGDIVRPGDDPG
ncbi:hypothetical protein [Aquimarina macrocephali]|uniref:hypothetical protein n=1 Tax=Aquimarina macrocephali TaxID=666563 RepID=UPI0004ADE4AF|nr:hypothetical protein [Aquimarina macrocephali]